MSQGVIKKLAQHGAAALKPRKVPTAPGQVNPWRRPLVSRREAAVARSTWRVQLVYGRQRVPRVAVFGQALPGGYRAAMQ